MKMKLKIFLGLEYIFFIIVFSYLYNIQKYHVFPLSEVIFFTLVLLITSNLSTITNTGKDILTSINLPILIPAMVIINPFWVAIISSLGSIKLRQIKDHFVWYQFLFNKTMLFIAAGGATLIFKHSLKIFNSQYLIFPFLLASIVYFVINNGLVFLVVKFAKEERNHSFPLLYFIELGKNLITSYFLGLLFYYSYIIIGKVFFILAIILVYVLKDFLYSRIQQLNYFTQIVESFLKVIDSKDHYTEGHCERVANYTHILCKSLGLTNSKAERIVNMAKIHDIGKIYVNDEILKSSDLLSPEEYEEMKQHSYYGYELLKDIDLLKQDLDIILYHHERFDGTGYPEGKKGKEIPLGARILSVCDAFDVMTTGRSYKPALSKKDVIEEFKEYSGKQFDPEIASVMVKLIKDGKFDDSFHRETESDDKLQLSLNFE